MDTSKVNCCNNTKLFGVIKDEKTGTAVVDINGDGQVGSVTEDMVITMTTHKYDLKPLSYGILKDVLQVLNPSRSRCEETTQVISSDDVKEVLIKTNEYSDCPTNLPMISYQTLHMLTKFRPELKDVNIWGTFSPDFALKDGKIFMVFKRVGCD